MANSTVCQSKWKPIVEPRRAKPKTYRQAPTHWLKFYEEAVIESEANEFELVMVNEPSTTKKMAKHPAPSSVTRWLQCLTDLPNTVDSRYLDFTYLE